MGTEIGRKEPENPGEKRGFGEKTDETILKRLDEAPPTRIVNREEDLVFQPWLQRGPRAKVCSAGARLGEAGLLGQSRIFEEGRQAVRKRRK